jgi:hypothetical protein
MPTTGGGYNNKNINNTSFNSTNSAAVRNASTKSAHHDSEDSDFSENVEPTFFLSRTNIVLIQS